MPITQIISGTDANEFFHVSGDGFIAPSGYVNRAVATAASEMILAGGGNDIVHGGGGGDYLSGDSGNDKLHGEAGDDQLMGGRGFDELHGGMGDDVYSVGDDDDYVPGDIDLVVEGAGQGIDRVYVYVPNYTLTANVEDGSIFFLHGTLKGNALDNDLFAGGGDPSNDHLFGFAGADTLNGGFGDDTVEGGIGADILIGGAGIDTAYYTSSSTGVTVSLAGGTGGGGDATGDVLSGIEQLYGSKFNDALIGSSDANGLWGGEGEDALTGGVGADRLKGGAGNDRFIYGSANDSTVAAAGRDVINDFSAGDRIDLSGIDADGQGANGNSAFRFGTGAFTGHAGELRVVILGTGYQAVYLDINGDRTIDSTIVVLSDHVLTAADFLL